MPTTPARAPAAPDDRRWPEGWSGPWWMQRCRPEPRRPVVEWTLLGDLASPARLAVDPRGYLWSPGAPWGLDWWIGADDRWHVPAREAAVRQSLVRAAPIVQTTLRVPAGDVHHRVLVVPAGDAAEAAVEVVNDSAAPVALALAVRPATLLAPGRVRHVELRDASVWVEGREVLRLPGRPSRALLVGAGDPDALVAVTGGAAPAAANGALECAAGLASAVVMVPLAHRSSFSFRVALGAAGPEGTATRRRRYGRARAAAAVGDRDGRRLSAPHGPDTAAASRGWRAQVERQVRLELPADRFSACLDAVRAHLLLAAGGDLQGADGAEVVVAAATAGLGLADAASLVEAARAARDGARRRPAAETAGSALWAAARLEDLAGARTGGAASGPGKAAAGTDVAAGAPDAASVAELAEGLARPGPDDGPAARAWSAAGLAAAAALLERAGEARAAATARAWRDRAMAVVASAGGDAALLGGVLAASGPVPAPANPLLAPPGDLPEGDAVDPARTLLWAAADLSAGRPWYERAAAVVAAGSPTMAWPDLIDPGDGHGCGTVGQSPLVTARLWALARRALIDDGDGLALLPGWTPVWRGQGLEAHGLPSRHGPVSFALRWHGARPALLWSVDGAPDTLVVTAPGIAASWRAAGPAGEALLPVPPGG